MARNVYNSRLRHTKATHWKGWLEELTEPDLWKAAHYAQNPLSDGSRACIPMLYTKSTMGEMTDMHSTDTQKAQIFHSMFFLPWPPQLPPYPGDSDPYPSPMPFSTPPISAIFRRLRKLRPYKAPGPDRVPNVVLQRAASDIAPALYTCLQAMLSLKYYPKAWRTWTTIVLRKPGCSDYTIAKAYHPVALF